MTTFFSERSIWDKVWAVTNEKGQKEVFEALAKEPSRGNAVFGCSGTYLLNLAAACEGIEYIAVFDVSQKVKELWEALPKIVLALDPSNLKKSQAHFYTWLQNY